MAITTECRKCRGTGKVRQPHLETLLERLRKRGGGIAADFATNGLGITAYNNRLEQLRRLGLVTRKKEGRFWRYEVK